jgi:hypothetical protein
VYGLCLCFSQSFDWKCYGRIAVWLVVCIT